MGQINCENHCEDHCLSIGEGHHQCPKDADNQVFWIIRVVEIMKVVISLQEISKNLSENLKIEISSCEQILVSPICSHKEKGEGSKAMATGTGVVGKR
jgi:hypothetical protein